MASSTIPTYVVTTVDYPLQSGESQENTIPLAIDQEGDIAGALDINGSGANRVGFYDNAHTGTFTEFQVSSASQTVIVGLGENGWISGTYNSGDGTYGYVANTQQAGSLQTISLGSKHKTFVTASDAAGDAVGYFQSSAGNDLITTGFVDFSGNIAPLSLLTGIPGDAIDSEVNSISENGHFIGGDYTDKTGQQHGFIENLPTSTFKTDGLGSTVEAVNDTGEAAGKADRTGSSLFFYNGSSTVTLPGESGTVTAMNDQGQTVGYDGKTGFLYTDGTVVAISGPGSDGTDTSTFLQGINNSGEIAGFYLPIGSSDHGLIATPQAQQTPVTLSLAITDAEGNSVVLNPAEGDTITATIGESSVSGATYTFTDGTDGPVLQASSSPSYTLGYNLTGNPIEVTASFTDSNGPETATASTGPVLTQDAPGSLTLSGLTQGNAVVGTPVVATIADPNGNPTGTVTYTFSDLKSGDESSTPLATGTSNTFTPTADEVGDTIIVTALYIDAQLFEDEPTASAGVVAAAEPASPPAGASGGSGGGAPNIPTATGQSVTTAQDTPDTITLGGTDSPPLPLTFAVATPPAHGTLSNLNAAAGTVVYTPSAGYVGPDSFAFTDSNGANTSAPATVTIAVTPPPTNNTITPTLAFDRTVSVVDNEITLSGTTTPGAAVELFADMGAAGRVDLGPATVDSRTGAWTLTYGSFTRGFHDGITATATLGGVTTKTISGLDLTTGLGPKHMGFTTILDDYDVATAQYLGTTFFKTGGEIFAKDLHLDLPDGGERYTYTGGSLLKEMQVTSFSASYIDDGNLTGSVLHNDDGTTHIENDVKYQFVNSHHDDTIQEYGSHSHFIFHDGAGHELITGFKLGSDTVALPSDVSLDLAKAIQVYDPDAHQFDTTIHLGHDLSITFAGVKKDQLLAHASDFGVHA